MWRRTIPVVGGIILLVSACLTNVSIATQVLYKSPRDLGEVSSVVVRGRVASVGSYWNPAHTKIFTRTRITVDQTYKGQPPASIDVVQPGGIVGNIKVTAHGALQWRVGEEVLVFAEPYDERALQVSGFFQGKFGIVRDPATGVAYVEAPAAEGVTLLGAPAPGRPGPQASRRSEIERVTVEEFVNQALGSRAGKGVER